MRKILLMAIAVSILAGCGTTTRELAKIDTSVQTLMQSDAKALTPDCRAGLAEGVTAGASVSPDIQATIVAMKEAADKDSKDYRDCKSWGAWVAFKVRAGHEKIDDMIGGIISQLTTFGVIK